MQRADDEGHDAARPATATKKPISNICSHAPSVSPTHPPISRLINNAMTRTWFNVRDQPIFAWAGLWRISDEWGPVYSGVMTDCNEAIRPVHDRMPVLLMPDEYERWLHGSFDDAVAFQSRCFPDHLIAMTRTAELWVKRKAPHAGTTPV